MLPTRVLSRNQDLLPPAYVKIHKTLALVSLAHDCAEHILKLAIPVLRLFEQRGLEPRTEALEEIIEVFAEEDAEATSPDADREGVVLLNNMGHL